MLFSARTGPHAKYVCSSAAIGRVAPILSALDSGTASAESPSSLWSIVLVVLLPLLLPLLAESTRTDSARSRRKKEASSSTSCCKLYKHTTIRE